MHSQWVGQLHFRMVNEFNKAKNTNQIRKLLNLLGNDFVISRDSNKRKGGLIGLAAVSIGLGKVSISRTNDRQKLSVAVFITGFGEVHQ